MQFLHRGERVDRKFFSAKERQRQRVRVGDSRQAVPFLADGGRPEEVLQGQQVEDAKEELFRQVVP